MSHTRWWLVFVSLPRSYIKTWSIHRTQRNYRIILRISEDPNIIQNCLLSRRLEQAVCIHSTQVTKTITSTFWRLFAYFECVLQMFVSPFSWYSFQGYLLNVYSWKKNILSYRPQSQFENLSTYLAALRITVRYLLTRTIPFLVRCYFTSTNCRGQVQPCCLQK